jgi:hypothetical protein
MPQGKPPKDEHGFISPFRARQMKMAASGYAKIPKSQVSKKNLPEWEKAQKAKKFMEEFKSEKS